MRKRAQGIIGRSLSVLSFIIGIASFAYSHDMSRIASGSPEWPVSEGAITKSRVVGVGGGKGGGGFKAEVQYVYEVDGVQYNRRRIQFHRERGDRAEARARKIVEQYPSGTAVRVHYHPQRHGVAVLEPSVEYKFPFGETMASAAFVGAAIMFWRVPIPLRGPLRRSTKN